MNMHKISPKDFLKSTALLLLVFLVFTGCRENVGQAFIGKQVSIDKLPATELNSNLILNSETVFDDLSAFSVQGAATKLPINRFVDRDWLASDSNLEIREEELGVILPTESLGSVAVSGTARVYDPFGFARIILVDENGVEYLAFGTDFLFIDEGVTEFKNVCEETCLLDDGVRIASARVELYKADIMVETLSYQDKDGVDKSRSFSQIKLRQNAEKLGRLHSIISENVLDWTAGDTTVSDKPYRELKKLFLDGKLGNLHGFQYYKGGTFRVAK